MGNEAYFLQKISIINYRMAIHEGSANRRLASQAAEILFKLFPGQVPDQYRSEFNRLLKLIENTLDDSGRLPIRIAGIRNKTAAKYIKLLLELEVHLGENRDV